MRSAVILPDSILLRIFLAHWTKASSTFSPVRALVSKNISSDTQISQFQLHREINYNDYPKIEVLPKEK